MFNWYKYELESPSFIDEAMKAKAYLLKARDAVEEAKYIEKLVFSDYVRIIRAAPSSWDYCTAYIKKAREQLNKTKKKEREDLSFVEHKVKESFFSELDFDIRIHEIIAGGATDYYWMFHFNIQDNEYIIQVPSRNLLTTENFLSAHEGKFVFLKKDSSVSISVLFDDWTEEGLAKKIKEYFNNEDRSDTAKM